MNRADRQAWNWCRTLADLGEMTARWLEGDTASQPDYAPGCGPDPETAPLIAVLAAANRAGYLTASSQPGCRETSGGTSWTQCAAVSGFATEADATRLAELATACGLAVMARQAPRWRSRRRDQIPVTIRDGLDFTWFGVVRSRWSLRDGWTGYGECHPDAVAAVCGAWQVAIIDPEWGREDSPVWGVLRAFGGAR